MHSLWIQDLPEDILQALARRAAAEHRSLGQQVIVELRRVLELTAPESRRAVLGEIKRRVATEPVGRHTPAPEAIIRGDRQR